MVGTVLKPLPGKELTGEENGLDDLFNYDASSNDPFGDDYQPAFSQEKNKITNETAESSGIDLGIDEKVEVARRPRAPRVKLDENLYEHLNFSDDTILICFKFTFSCRYH